MFLVAELIGRIMNFIFGIIFYSSQLCEQIEVDENLMIIKFHLTIKNSITFSFNFNRRCLSYVDIGISTQLPEADEATNLFCVFFLFIALL